MKRLARFSFQRRRVVLAGWLLGAVILLAVSSTTGSKFNSDFNLPGTDSQTAVSLLTKNFPAASGEGDQVVFQASRGANIRSPAVKGRRHRGPRSGGEGPRYRRSRQPLWQGAVRPRSVRTGTIAFATVTWNKADAEGDRRRRAESCPLLRSRRTDPRCMSRWWRCDLHRGGGRLRAVGACWGDRLRS